MTTGKDLLPGPVELEAALAEALTDTLPIPLAEAVDPHKTPVRFLPFLGQHDGVRLWYADWSEARKRQVIAEAPVLARKIGTRAGVLGFLSYVDATLLDVIAYPTRFILGRSVIGRTPVGHQPWVARYLIKIETTAPARAFVMGRAVIGRHRLKTPSREPFQRVMAALRAAKSPETQYRVDFGHKRPLVLADQPRLADDIPLGGFVARQKL
ncbi:phage tail protein I [Microvirga sp. RSM25]|uniref:phage tail protein I n=1 Tax=Microvirga sp. RSM25 TaxID=3273802 RepID=UPI003850899E